MAGGGGAAAFRWTKEITPSLVLKLIRAERDTRKALAIFESATAEYSNGYRHDASTFSLMISRLASANLFSAAEGLLTRMCHDENSIAVPEDVFVTLCRAYGRAHRPADALRLFRTMGDFQCVPTAKSYVTVLDALVDGNVLREAHQFYKEMKNAGVVQGCLPAYNVIMKAFCKSEQTVDIALQLFEKMASRGCPPDSYTYGTLINGLFRLGRMDKALDLFREMQEEGHPPSVVTYSSLVHGYCRGGKLDDAVRVLEEMTQKGIKPNVVTYSTLVDGFCKGGRSAEALDIVRKMEKERIPPNMITYSSLVYGLCSEGKVLEAQEAIDRMRLAGCKPDAGLYGKLIKRLVEFEKYHDAANFLDEMVLGGIKPNRLTWGLHIRIYNMVLRGLCTGHDVNRAFQLYLGMRTRSITTEPQTYHLLVDCFCKKGDAHKAARVVNEMLLEGCPPESITWEAIMGSYWDRRKVREEAEFLLAQIEGDS